MKLLLTNTLLGFVICFSENAMAQEWNTTEALRAFGKPGDTVREPANKEVNTSAPKREKKARNSTASKNNKNNSTPIAVSSNKDLPRQASPPVVAPQLSASDKQEYQRLVNDMNKSLPMMTSSEMQLTRVYMRSNEVVYVTKSIKLDRNQTSPAILENKIKPATVNGLCTAPDSSNMIKKGLVYTYVFYDKENKYISEYSISTRDCGF